jgi:hypothetical protein
VAAIMIAPALLLPILVGLAARSRDQVGFGGACREALRGTLRLLPGLPVGVGVMVLLWPWSGLDWRNALVAVETFKDFPFDGKVLFEGAVVPAADVPGIYLPLLLGLTLPEVMLTGLGLGALLAAWQVWRRGAAALRLGLDLRLLAVVTAAAFPILFFVLTAPTAYNGIRHYLFILPPLAVLAALAVAHLWQRARPSARAVLAVGVGAGLLLPTARMVELHPDEYVYFNDLSGGVKAAQGRFELDYWGTSLAEATAKLTQRLTAMGLAHPLRPWRVYVCADTTSAAYFFPPYLTAVPTPKEADFVVALNQFYCPQMGREQQVARVERDGALLSWVGDAAGVLTAGRTHAQAEAAARTAIAVPRGSPQQRQRHG